MSSLKVALYLAGGILEVIGIVLVAAPDLGAAVAGRTKEDTAGVGSPSLYAARLAPQTTDLGGADEMRLLSDP